MDMQAFLKVYAQIPAITATKDTAAMCFKAAWNMQQAKIDELMLEFCPNEMTPQQISDWKASQRVYQLTSQELAAIKAKVGAA